MSKKLFIFLIISGLLLSLNVYAGGDLTSPGYTVDIGNMGFGGTKILSGNGAETGYNFVTIMTIKLLIGIGFFSLFTMVVGGAYMIFSNGKDELLSKGKGIFGIGVLGLIIALSASGIMKLVTYIIY